MKRLNYISWDELFIGIAELASKRSKDPNTQNGACVVSSNNRILGVGYNGFPDGCSDDEFSWSNEEKHNYVIHAEVNAILNTSVDLTGAKIYLYSENGYYPCSDCAKIIVQKGIKELVLKFVSDNIKEEYKGKEAKRMFKAGNVKVRILNRRDNEEKIETKSVV